MWTDPRARSSQGHSRSTVKEPGDQQQPQGNGDQAKQPPEQESKHLIVYSDGQWPARTPAISRLEQAGGSLDLGATSREMPGVRGPVLLSAAAVLD